jgi:hypothetical protein
VIAEGGLIFRRWVDWTPIAEIPPHEFDPDMRGQYFHGKGAWSEPFLGGFVVSQAAWHSDGKEVLRY